MLRTIWMAIYFVVYLVLLFPQQWKISRLEKQGKIKELEALLHDIALRWGRGIVKNTGTKVSVSGSHHIPEGPVLFVSNHQGNLDIPLLLGFIDKPKSFIAKVELSKIPVFGKWMERINCIFIDRNDPRQSLRAINQGVEILKNGHSMVIFPEGTRSQGPKMSDFKKGSLRLATKAKVPIVPITIQGSYKIMEANGGLIKPAEVSITISEPIYTDQLTKEEENGLSDRVYDIIQSHL